MSDTYTALSDMVTFLESIDKTLDRIAEVMEADQADRKAREEAEERVRFARAEQEEREEAEAQQRWRATYAADAGVTVHEPADPPF
jgi:hypothetical protein